MTALKPLNYLDGHQILVRPDTYDEPVVREQSSYSRLGIKPGDAVIDIGANIGAFARWAVHQGASMVWSIEPDPDNFALARQNVECTEGKVTLTHAAVVRGDSPTAELWLNSGMNKGMHSTVQKRGRSAVTVPAVSLDRVLAWNLATVIKVDVEGAEYGLFDGVRLPYNLRALAMEFHLSRKSWREEAVKLCRQFELQGFSTVLAPVFDRPLWATLGVWARG